MAQAQMAQPAAPTGQMPVAYAIPVVPYFQAVPVVAIPVASPWQKMPDSGMNAQVYSILANANELTIREQVKLLPEHCCGCPPCLRQAKSYYISAGMDKTGTDMSGLILRADEVSEKWSRCCLHPNHSWKVEFRQYVPEPSEIQGQSGEAAIFGQDFHRDMGQMSFTEKGKKMRDKYMQNPVAFTGVRNGMMCCPCTGCWNPLACGCNMCLGGGCFSCCDCCLDNMAVVAGPTKEAEDKEIGRTFDPSMALGYAKVPCLGGHCTPTVWLNKTPFDDGVDTPWSKMEGPTCFGGCSELCCDFHFPFSKGSSDRKTGDHALLKKRRPRGVAAGLRELVTDSDVFTIQFKDTSLTPEEKALILSNTILTDFMFFEGGTSDKCGQTEDGQGCYINLCNVYCYGCIVPCRIECRSSGDS